MQAFKTFLSDYPSHGWLGLLLIVEFWTVNWIGDGLRTSWAFFPLWLGYCLAVDGLVLLRKGTSLFTRSKTRYLGLFAVSVLGWWLFELLNWRTQNWAYLGTETFSRLEYGLLASLSFSTVIPAVFGTAELVGTFGWVKRLEPGWKIADTKRNAWLVFLLGWLMLALMLAWPRYFFPFMWLSVFFILEPINLWLGNRTLASSVSKGDWRPLVSLWLGGLICGFFWELWNFYSYPKWVYFVPGVDFWHIFEMPALGYGGYLPFAMELYAMYHYVRGVFGKQGQGYVELG
ncbi:MAG: hypothetical protein ABFS17_03395 [Chloroflexota bacterium]